MRSGPAAATFVLAILLCGPALAEPVAPAPTNAAAAAAAAARAAKPPPKSDETAPAQQAAVPEAAPAAAATAAPAAPVTSPSMAPAPVTGAEDEAPAEPGATPDAPPAQAAVAPPADEAAKADAPKSSPADVDTAKAAPAAADAAAPSADTPAKPKLIAAKTLFGAAKSPAPLAARSIGTYARGCLAGAVPLAVDGPAWQAMRLSRNRTWGHPKLIAMLERFAGEVKQDGWPGLLVGDIAQPRGGPMLTGHASHQLGLDADIWFTPMPDHRLTKKERETLAATSMLASDSLSVDPKVWTDSRVKIIKRVSSYPEVERVLVHPAIKKALCEAAGTDRHWLNKVRPYWGHFYHFHVRIGCPDGSPNCKAQAPVPGDDGCGKELDDWFKLLTRKPKPKPPGEKPVVVKPAKPKPPITLDDLPPDCRTVLATGSDIKLPAPALASTGHPIVKKVVPAKAAAPKPAAKPTEKKVGATKAAAAKSSEKTKKE